MREPPLPKKTISLALTMASTALLKFSRLIASIVAFIQGGVFKDYDDAIRNMVHETDVFEPRKKEHETYMDLYSGAYRKIFGKLEPIYRRIIKITKRRDIQ